ncbi:acyl-CoA dehydrogenase family protein [Saccharopolyspora cebuensis]|uniref:Acyl-CoA dehydrogenase family protein n=1 Tax=Saccharopolyspora cebuensis TaxID=418759 RepID=A0ABV4CCR6_9PSEU
MPEEDRPGPVERAGALRELLAEHRERGERERRLAGPVVEALESAGFFRMMVPRAFGGAEHELAVVVDATAELAKGDPSAAWAVMILGCGDWLTAQYPDAAQREVFGDAPDTRVCQVLTPKATARHEGDRWRVSGRWAPASGCRHSGWAMLGVALDEPGGPAAWALVPIEELAVRDTWHTLGMRATGSELLVGEDLAIPEHRLLRTRAVLDGRAEHRHSARLRTALVPTLLTCLLGPVLGMAEAALEHVLAQAEHRSVPFTTYRRLSDSTAVQLALAEATAKTDVARTTAHALAAEVDGAADRGVLPDRLRRARMRLRAAHAVRECREAVDVLVDAYGAGALADSDPLNRLLRDVQTATRHAVANPAVNAEIYGRAVLGLDPAITEMV